ncbi:Hpt domain-containing protein, partial [Rudaea sp.]|uniref:Hpt domain-containing protein n=1 Tax=Rudaea sp. TaxID=2136325 RepID=UPI002ED502EE
MNLAQETDFTTLGWLKPELDVTLKESRQALERYAANPADMQAMRNCAGGLHTTFGTLNMVELYGAALVVEEMERVARGLADGSIMPREDIYSVLMRGFLQLPDYIERLQSGHKDIPIVLLPLLNDLRAARGEKLLSEAVMFAPNIDAALPEPPAQAPDAQALRTAATGLRNEYQFMLLRWIREPGATAPLARIGQIFDTLYAGSSHDAARRLWWVSGAVVEGLQSGAIEASVAMKLLFGKLDREIKHLIDSGEAALDTTAAKELVKNLLYYLAHASARGERAKAVIEFYSLDHLLPTREELEHAHGSISGHNRALLDSVAGGIREDLIRVKETLNVFLHSPQRNPADLVAQANTLGSLADTFGMLGMGVPRLRVLEQRTAIDQIVHGEIEADEGNLLDIAGGLLVVEASLEDHISRLGAKPEDTEDTEGQVPRAEVVRLMYVLMKEALVNVAKVKDTILAFAVTPLDHAQLEPTPGLLVEVAGALDMLALGDAVKPVNAMVHYIRNELLERRRVPDPSHIDALADAVASIEYYIEAVREQRGDRERVLGIMRDSLAKLNYWPEIKPSSEDAAPDSAADAAAPTPAAPPVAAVPAAHTPVAQPLIDEELRQVFLDEMDEEIANLRRHFPLWRAQPEETEDLKIVRRSFHTLKGSGRLVGALELGDFAWKVESTLNRVLDHSIPASASLMQVVSHAIGALPRFRDEFARSERSSFAMDGFAAAVDRLCAGDTSPIDENLLAGIAPPAPAAVEPVADAVVAEAPVPVEEPVATDVPAIETPPAFEVEPLVDDSQIVAVESSEHAEWSLVEIEHSSVTAESLAAVDAEPVPAAEPVAFADAPAAAAEQEELAPAADDTTTAEHEVRFEPTPSAPQVDQLLLDVLRSEADVHLGVIDAAVAHGRERTLMVREELVRAVHTLNGAFAMVEAPQITQLLMPLEGWLARLRNANRPLDAHGVDTLAAVSAEVRAALAAFETGAAIPDTGGLSARIAALREGVHAGETIVAVEPEAPIETETLLAPQAPIAAETLLEPEVPTTAELPVDELEPVAEEMPAVEYEIDPADAKFLRELEEADAPTVADAANRSDLGDAAGVEPSPESIEAAQIFAEAESTPETIHEAEPPARAALPIETDAGLTATEFESATAAYERLLAQTFLPPAQPPVEQPLVETEEAAFFDAAHEHVEAAAEVPATDADATPSPPAEAEMPAALAEIPAAPAQPEQVHEPAPVDALHPVPDIDEDLLDIFVLESQEILDRSDALVLRLRGAADDTSLLDELRRDLHTIKGGANMSALASIGDLGHAMESLLEGVVEHGRALDGAMLHAVEQGFDTLHTLVQAAAARQPTTMPTALIARIEALSRSEADTESVFAPLAAEPEREVAEPAESVQEPLAAVSESAPETPVLAEAQTETTEPVFAGSEYIRVRAAQLDAMVNGASEVAIYRSRLEQQLASYRTNVVEMEATVSRLREQMRRLELEAEAQMASRFQREGDASSFDPLELDRFSQLQQLSRSLAESMSDLFAIQIGFDQLTRQSESLLMQQSRVSADLQESLMRARMVPFDSLVPALRRTLRQTATSLGKEALLRVEGAQGEMDRTLLERMKAPIEHMLRNALAHGIEAVPERLAAGKPIEGNVRITLAREATETVLRISDDGRGLDRAAIRRRAIERGLLAQEARIGDRELDAFILTSGFSTAESLTQLSGRGVGMDVVASQIKQLGGSLAIESNPGRGAAFTVRLPFTLGVTQAIIVRLGDANYAIPMNAVQGAVHIARSELDTRLAAEEPEYTYAGESYPILDLAPQLGEVSPAVHDDVHVPLLIVRSGDQRAAVRVDHVLGSREIVVKPVGPQITSVPGILGATIMGDGSVIMILDL